MGLAIIEEHVDLAAVTDSFLAHHNAVRAARAALEVASEGLPPFWPQIREMGWLGLHLPERFGGDGFTLAESAVVVEQFGKHAAPGPLLTTVMTSAVLSAIASDGRPDPHLSELSTGRQVGAIGIAGDLKFSPDGSVVGSAGAVLGGAVADLLLVCVGDDVVLTPVAASGVQVTELRGLDPSRRPARVEMHELRPTLVVPGAAATAKAIVRFLVAAEATGIAAACTEMAAKYAGEREQFGRVIGTFQAVKHHCANMFVDTEMAVAATWGAARDITGDQAVLAAAAAYSVAVRAAVTAAERNIQVHGGIGFTWEHDAHIYLRRALALRAIFGSPDLADAELARIAASGRRRQYSVDLPAEAEQFRADAAQVARRVAALSKKDRRAELVAAGYLTPHWPKPWGLGAGAAQQLVIDEEFENIKVPSLGITGWNVLTIIQHGTPEQLDRWVEKSLLGELVWCQLFSEPAAGSDAAAIRTAGTKVPGGWRVTGQKVWTTGAHRSQWGFATVRTDSSRPKHTGVTMMAIDMTAPGVTVRPLREITGDAVFNEVFLDDVFVPDADVVGAVGEGWVVARSTLGNEKVSIGSAPTALTVTACDLVEIDTPRIETDEGHLRRAGALIAEEQALTLLNLRQAVRAIEGAGPGPEGNVTKLVRAEHGQRVTEFALDLIGQDGADGAGDVVKSYLLGRCYTIAGGTSEVLRNQIAERLLKLPRDPLLK
jgi:alkylation response protein AidB-like acyl-CoA dehydrogenase